MEATKEVTLPTIQIEADLRSEQVCPAVRELSALELSLVGGGAGHASFL